MHPAPSVILFTSLSGAGFGLLAFLGLGIPPVTGWSAFFFYLVAYLLAAGGLVSSTFHLGHPERALKAFTQWRSSWLSREGVAAVAALVVMGLFALGQVFFGAVWQPLGWLGAVLSLATVFTTSMIYAQMKTVPRWNQPLTPALYLAFAVTGGALLSGRVTLAIALMILTAILQLGHWWKGDTRFAEAGSTMESATRLGDMGRVRAFEPPHTGPNYLTREFMYDVARRHVLRLRGIGFALAFVLPVLFLLLPFSHLWALLAVLSHIAGVLTTRWLFFAEAEHVVGLYYGARPSVARVET